MSEASFQKQSIWYKLAGRNGKRLLIDLWWVPTGTRVRVCTLHSYRGVGLGINRASPSVTGLDRTCPWNIIIM